VGRVREWAARLGALLTRRERDGEDALRAELEFHRDQLEADLVRSGLEPGVARREAARRLGGMTQVAEAWADQRSWGPGEALVQDVRYALRGFRRTPGFTTAAVATLALGIGATTAVLTVAHALLIRPLPYAAPDRLTVVSEGPEGTMANIGFGTFTELRDRAQTLQGIAAIRSWQATLVTSEAERLQGMRVSWNYFELLGVDPALGRRFTNADDHPDRWRVVLLSDGLWRRRFGADPRVIGQTIRMNDLTFEIIGVMPAGFDDLLSDRFYRAAEIWAPLGYAASVPSACRSCRHLKAVAGLAPGRGPADASAELDAIRTSLAAQFPADYGDGSMAVRPLAQVIAGDVRTPLVVLLGAATFVLLIACANVASLLLARGSARSRELAVRSALGAGRGRILRQLVTESLLLWSLGGIAGAALAALAVRTLVAASPVDLPRAATIVADGPVLLSAIAVAVVTGLLFGVIPALVSSRGLGVTLSSTRSVTSGSTRLRQALIAVDLAVAIVLLVGAGLMTRSVARLLDVDPGFNPDGVLTAQFSLVGTAYREDAPVRTFIDQLVARAAVLPGVSAAAAAGQVPMGGNRDQFGIYVEGLEPARGGDAPSAERYSVTPDYFRVMEIPLVRGRLFAAWDRSTSDPVVVLSETAARTLFTGLDPIGRRLRVGSSPGTPWRTVVGIVGDVRHTELSETAWPQLYLPQSQFTDSFLVLTLRTATEDPAELAPAVRRILKEMDPAVPMYDVARLDALVAATSKRKTFVAGLLGTFSVVSLMLAAVGLYGVVSYAVAGRTREVGLRMALGAGPGRILRMVFGTAAVPFAAGLTGGLLLSLPLGFWLRSELYEVEPIDPVTLAVAMSTILLVAGIAHLVPIRRALRIDPTVALRDE
jgi:putative ABC transport system permease protein